MSILGSDSVVYDLLAKHVDILRGKRLTKRDLIDGGEFPVLQGGTTPMGYYNKYNRRENTTVIVNTGNAGYVLFSDKKFWSSDACFVLYPHEELIDKFLYYVVKNQEDILYSKIRIGAMPTIDANAVRNLVIPIPPIETQQKIVSILDRYTSLNTELISLLERELVLRRKQYEYYRDKLLACNVNNICLSDIAQYSTLRIEASEVNENNYIGVDNLLPDKKGKTKSVHVPASGKLTAYRAGDILIGNIRPYLRKIWFADTEGGTNGDVLAIHVTDTESVYPKYLYYVLSSEEFFIYAAQNSRGAKMPRGDKQAVMQYKFGLPSMDEQYRIAAILDKFNTVCTSLTEGLPAEIAARKKQYEHYRDRLLTFKPHLTSP